MDYHLHREGQSVGVFPLEELRRRRATGELTGSELVWREGMPNWATLDTMLQTDSGAQPPPIPAAALKPKSNRGLVWVLSIAGVVAGLTLASFTTWKFVEGF